MKCPMCGKKINSEATHCPHCGEAVNRRAVKKKRLIIAALTVHGFIHGETEILTGPYVVEDLDQRILVGALLLTFAVQALRLHEESVGCDGAHLSCLNGRFVKIIVQEAASQDVKLFLDTDVLLTWYVDD